MCGIAAILLFPEERSPDMWREIGEAFTKNLLFNEKRGKAATGMGIFNSDQTVIVEKQAVSAHEFVETSAYQGLLKSFSKKTALILGHTRYPTKGDPSNMNNNHPLQVNHLYGIHNGHIKNDDFLFEKWKFSRQAEVDSEVILHLLAEVSEISALPSIKSNLQLLQGKFTLLAVDHRCPYQLLVIKHQNPLSIHFCPHWKALIFSSSYLFLRKTFGTAVVKEKLPSDQLSLFNSYLLDEHHHLAWQQIAF
ncbi:MAG: hypothetical protein AB4058_12360 [Microcystaceae cyanobacterium]